MRPGLQKDDHMRDVVIGKASSFPDPGRKVVELDGTEVGVFCVNGKFTAFENVCPHMGGPVCQGKIIPRVQEVIAEDKTSLGLAFSKDQTSVACPWHGYEFDIQTGRHQGNPRLRLRPVKIEIVDGDLVVTVPEGMRERIARARSKEAEGRSPA
jgi:nitrite reductase/ring-hydroxylating ferredoxin subunit